MMREEEERRTLDLVELDLGRRDLEIEVQVDQTESSVKVVFFEQAKEEILWRFSARRTRGRLLRLRRLEDNDTARRAHGHLVVGLAIVCTSKSREATGRSVARDKESSVSAPGRWRSRATLATSLSESDAKP